MNFVACERQGAAESCDFERLNEANYCYVEVCNKPKTIKTKQKKQKNVTIV